jgi:hypothetical protein
MKVDLTNRLRNGRTIRLTPEDDEEVRDLRYLFSDLLNHPYVELTCDGVGTISLQVVNAINSEWIHST